jgi:hypothetical protein
MEFFLFVINRDGGDANAHRAARGSRYKAVPTPSASDANPKHIHPFAHMTERDPQPGPDAAADEGRSADAAPGAAPGARPTPGGPYFGRLLIVLFIAVAFCAFMTWLLNTLVAN